MYSIFKDTNRLLVNGANESEQLVMAEFIEMAKSGNYELVINKLLDINGDATGMCIELVEIVNNDNSEPSDSSEEDNQEEGSESQPLTDEGE
jgi:hypothetical protein